MNSTNEVAQASPVPSQHLAITEAYQARKKATSASFKTPKANNATLFLTHTVGLKSGEMVFRISSEGGQPRGEVELTASKCALPIWGLSDVQKTTARKTI